MESWVNFLGQRSQPRASRPHGSPGEHTGLEAA